MHILKNSFRNYPEQVEIDYANLISILLPLTKENLSFGDGVLPVGASMDSNGEIRITAHAPEGLPNDGGESIIWGLFKKFQSEGLLRACALAYSCQFTVPQLNKRTSAVAVRLEHKDGPPFVWYFPYERQGSQIHYPEKPGTKPTVPEYVMMDSETQVFSAKGKSKWTPF